MDAEGSTKHTVGTKLSTLLISKYKSSGMQMNTASNFESNSGNGDGMDVQGPIVDVQRSTKPTVSTHEDCNEHDSESSTACGSNSEHGGRVIIGCDNDGARLAALIKTFKSNGDFDPMMVVFLHSFSCKKTNCRDLCHMFRRVMNHILLPNHDNCLITKTFFEILEYHVKNCNNTDCKNVVCMSKRKKLFQD